MLHESQPSRRKPITDYHWLSRRGIDALTGFDEQDEFCSEAEVRLFFRTEEILYAYDQWVSQDLLDEMAEIVIENRWNCNFAS